MIAIPAGVVLAGATSINCAVAVPMYGFLTLATISLFTSTRTGLELGNKDAYFLLAMYEVFLAWIMAETFGFLSIIPAWKQARVEKLFLSAET